MLTASITAVVVSAVIVRSAALASPSRFESPPWVSVSQTRQVDPAGIFGLV